MRLLLSRELWGSIERAPREHRGSTEGAPREHREELSPSEQNKPWSRNWLCKPGYSYSGVALESLTGFALGLDKYFVKLPGTA